MSNNVPVIDNVGRYIINFLRFLVETLFTWTETLIYIFDTPISTLFEDLGINVEVIIVALTVVFNRETALEILSFHLLGLIFGVGVLLIIGWTVLKWLSDAFL